MCKIQIKHLHFVYGQGTPLEKVALNDVSLNISQGDFVGIIGQTGSGKSTLVQNINGLLKPTSGEVYLDGQNIWANKKHAHKTNFKIGTVFQYPEYQLFEDTVYKDIAFGPKNMGLGEKQIAHRVLEATKLVGLPNGLLNKSPFDLSGGEKRRVAIAGVISMEPDVLILDEPTSGLDPIGKKDVLTQIQKLHKKKKNTILMISHCMEDIATYSDKVLVLNNGNVAMYDITKSVFNKADDLLNMGLDIPEITKIILDLKKKGFPLAGGVLTVDQALNEILKLL